MKDIPKDRIPIRKVIKGKMFKNGPKATRRFIVATTGD